MDFSNMRQEYQTEGIDEANLAPNPIDQFHAWIAEAVSAGLYEPNAMVLSTSDAENQPWSRYVLLKGVSENGFEFYTNYESHKSDHLDTNPQASLTFGWLEMHRQIKIAGQATRVSGEESDAYWSVRPRGSQLGAWASPQSAVVSDRDELLDKIEKLDQKYPEEVPRPDNWGGWRVVPDSVEFWQGREDRLHDSFKYSKIVDGEKISWKIERLAP